MVDVTQIGFQINKNPLAQSFYVDTRDGIFLTKVGVFFSQASLDPSFPVTLQLRPVVNGVPSATTIIPGSTVVKSQSDIKSDVDQYLQPSPPALATVETVFEFSAPIYLQGETLYSLVLQSNSSDYKVYIAETYEFKVGTTEQRVDKNPISGTLFTSTNSVTYTPVQNQDLTFKLYKARFNHASADVRLKNAAVPAIQLPPNPIDVTNGSTVVKVNHEHHALQTGDEAKISGATSIGSIPAGSINGNHAIVDYDITGYTIDVGVDPGETTSGGGSEVYADKNIMYSWFIPKVQNLKPSNTNVFVSWRGTESESISRLGTSYNKRANFSNVSLDKANYTIGRTFLIASNKQEADNMGGDASLDVNAELLSFNTRDVAPYIDLQRCSFTGISYYIDNQNPDWVTQGDASTSGGFNEPLNYIPETNPDNGSSAAKHVTKVFTLEELAKGLKIFIGVNKPEGASVDVYYRTSTEGDNIKQKSWIYLDPVVDLPADANPTIFREYEYLAGGEGGDLDDFSQYQIKIVFRAQYQRRVPVIRDLRAIALVA